MISYLEQEFPLKRQEEWDNSGLAYRAKGKVDKIMITLTVTEQTIDKAVEQGVDLIISHHPIDFKNWAIDQNNELDFQKSQKIYQLLQEKQLSLYVLHTNYDKSMMNQYFYRSLGLDIVETKCLAKEIELGLIGRLRKEIQLLELIKILKEKLGLKKLKISAVDLERKIEKISICAGSGKDLLDFAIKNSDVYLTGDTNYHAMEKACHYNYPLIDIGHHESETLGFKGLYEKLASVLNVKIIYYESENFHINY